MADDYRDEGMTMDRFLDFLTRAGISGAAAWLLQHMFGPGPHTLLGAYATLVVLDVVSGTSAAIIRRDLRAEKAGIGVLKKLMGFCAIATGHVADTIVGTGDIARNTMALLLCSYELQSITENLAVAGIVVPDTVRDLFAKVWDQRADAAARSHSKEKERAP